MVCFGSDLFFWGGGVFFVLGVFFLQGGSVGRSNMTTCFVCLFCLFACLLLFLSVFLVLYQVPVVVFVGVIILDQKALFRRGELYMMLVDPHFCVLL